MSTEPPPSRFRLPDPAQTRVGQEMVAVGGDLSPGLLLAGYRSGLFALPHEVERGRDVLGWWSPDPRGVLVPARVEVSRSLRRSIRRAWVSIDQAFDAVVAGCADPSRPHGWITEEYREAYNVLHALGWAHSVEVWDSDGLAGGLFGVELGGLFAAESKFHVRTDASKVAVAALAHCLAGDRRRLIDVQWATPHLLSLGVVEIPRTQYLRRLRQTRRVPAALRPTARLDWLAVGPEADRATP